MSRSRYAVVLLVSSLIATALLLAPPAQAAAARTLSVSAKHDAALVGTKVTFSGRVSTSPKGSGVRIQRKVGGTWKTVKAASTTSGAGRYSAKVALPSKPGVYKYRAYAPAFEGLRAAASKVVTVKALRRTRFAELGGSDVLYGRDGFGGASAVGTLKKRFTKGAAATVQRRTGKTWTNVGAGTVGANGVFEVDFPEKAGTYRVVIGRKGLNASAISKARKVTFG